MRKVRATIKLSLCALLTIGYASLCSAQGNGAAANADAGGSGAATGAADSSAAASGAAGAGTEANGSANPSTSSNGLAGATGSVMDAGGNQNGTNTANPPDIKANPNGNVGGAMKVGANRSGANNVNPPNNDANRNNTRAAGNREGGNFGNAANSNPFNTERNGTAGKANGNAAASPRQSTLQSNDRLNAGPRAYSPDAANSSIYDPNQNARNVSNYGGPDTNPDRSYLGSSQGNGSTSKSNPGNINQGSSNLNQGNNLIPNGDNTGNQGTSPNSNQQRTESLNQKNSQDVNQGSNAISDYGAPDTNPDRSYLGSSQAGGGTSGSSTNGFSPAGPRGQAGQNPASQPNPGFGATRRSNGVSSGTGGSTSQQNGTQPQNNSLNLPNQGSSNLPNGQTGQTPWHSTPNGATGANNSQQDWREVYYNNRWWYYTPQNNWMYYDNSQWNPYNGPASSSSGLNNPSVVNPGPGTATEPYRVGFRGDAAAGGNRTSASPNAMGTSGLNQNSSAAPLQPGASESSLREFEQQNFGNSGTGINSATDRTSNGDATQPSATPQ
jgi:hypothetical protein